MPFKKGHKKPENAYSFEKGHLGYNHKPNSGSFKKGHKTVMTQEMKDKIGAAGRTRTYPLRPSPFKGKKHLEESRIKMSETHKKIGSGDRLLHLWGENHPNWKGGNTDENIKIRQSTEGRLWREAVFARDNWTCQITGIRGGKLVAHHIQNFAQFPELRFAIDNGITLSDKSHQEFHKKYGKRNNTREQLEEFMRLQQPIQTEKMNAPVSPSSAPAGAPIPQQVATR